MHGPEGAGAAPARASRIDPEPGLPQRPLLPEEVRQCRVQSRRGPLPRRPGPAALHGQGRPAGELPLRPLRRSAPGGGARPCLVRHDRHVHRGGLHEERHQELVEPRRPHPDRWRHHGGRRDPDRLQLRPLHRRLRPALRRRARRRLGHPHVEREHPAPDQDHAGLQDHGAGQHAELCHPDRGHDEGDGHQSQHPLAQVGPLRRRAMVRGHAQGDPGQAQDRGHGQLRPLGDHGTRHLGRVPGAERPPYRRGPFPGRGHRSQDAAAPAGRRGRRARHHDAHQGGLPHDPVPDPGSDADHRGALRLRPDPAPHEPRHGADRRHAHHPGRERLPLPDRDRALRHRGDRAALPDRHRTERGARRDRGPGRGIGEDLLR